MQYESHITSGLKVIGKVKVYQKVKKIGTKRKVLSQAIHMCNIKALSFLLDSYG